MNVFAGNAQLRFAADSWPPDRFIATKTKTHVIKLDASSSDAWVAKPTNSGLAPSL
jgi:hypothetical protein